MYVHEFCNIRGLTTSSLLLSRSLAVDLLKGSHSPDITLAKVCGRCAASVDEINHLHTQVQDGGLFGYKNQNMMG